METSGRFLPFSLEFSLEIRSDGGNGARHSLRVSGAVFNLILGLRYQSVLGCVPKCPDFARPVECPGAKCPIFAEFGAEFRAEFRAKVAHLSIHTVTHGPVLPRVADARQCPH